MGSRIRRALSRATLAAIGAAAGGWAGGLISRQAASSGAALGAFAGATVADVRSDPGGFFAALRSDDEDEALDAADDASSA